MNKEQSLNLKMPNILRKGENIKNFKKYVDLYLGDDKELTLSNPVEDVGMDITHGGLRICMSMSQGWVIEFLGPQASAGV